jgi:hypothetical protein
MMVCTQLRARTGGVEMDSYDARATRRRKTWGIALFLIGGALWPVVAGALFVLSTYHGAGYNCIVAGPWSDRAYPGEASPVSAGFSWWPAGRVCEWPTADANVTVIVYSDSWVGTSVLVALAAIVALGAVMAVVPQAKDKRGRDAPPR